MRIIGITGTLGSGKSEVLRYLGSLGARVIDSDQITRELSEPGEPLYLALVREFGSQILCADRRLDKDRLRRMIFDDPKELRRINQVSEQILVGTIVKRIMSMNAKDTVALEAIRLFDSGLHRICDEVWYVYCESTTQRQRIFERNRWDKEHIQSILSGQQSVADRMERADQVIDNSGTPQQTQQRIDKLYGAK